MATCRKLVTHVAMVVADLRCWYRDVLVGMKSDALNYTMNMRGCVSSTSAVRSCLVTIQEGNEWFKWPKHVIGLDVLATWSFVLMLLSQCRSETPKATKSSSMAWPAAWSETRLWFFLKKREHMFPLMAKLFYFLAAFNHAAYRVQWRW